MEHARFRESGGEAARKTPRGKRCPQRPRTLFVDCGLDDRDTPGEWSSIFHVCLYLDGEVASARRTSFVHAFVVWEQQDGNMAVVLDLVACS
jgi:hypothetical protein